MKKKINIFYFKCYQFNLKGELVKEVASIKYNTKLTVKR